MTRGHQSDPDLKHARVVLQSRTATPNRLALESAVHLAKALRVHIQSVFVEDQDVLALADLPFAVEISTTGRSVPIADFAAMEKKMRLAAASVRQSVDRLAQINAVTCEHLTVRGGTSEALAPHCSGECFVVMADTFDAPDMIALRHLFEGAAGLGGALLVGPQAKARTGPVVIVSEGEGLSKDLLLVAERVARERHLDEIVILATSESMTDARIKQALEDNAPGLVCRTVRPKHGVNALHSIVQAVHDLKGSIVVASHANRLEPGRGQLRELVNALSAPLILVR